MTRPEATELWRKRLDDCAQSGETIVYWCYLNHVSVHQYYYWKRRLAQIPTPATAPEGWMPVDMVDTASHSVAPTGVTVRIAGAAIELTPGFDPATLRAVVVALSALPC